MENVCLVKMNRMLEKSEWGGTQRGKMIRMEWRERERERKGEETNRGGDLKARVWQFQATHFPSR